MTPRSPLQCMTNTSSVKNLSKRSVAIRIPLESLSPPSSSSANPFDNKENVPVALSAVSPSTSPEVVVPPPPKKKKRHSYSFRVINDIKSDGCKYDQKLTKTRHPKTIEKKGPMKKLSNLVGLKLVAGPKKRQARIQSKTSHDAVIAVNKHKYSEVVKDQPKFQETYEIDRIMDVAVDKSNQQVFLVAWKGWNYTSCTYQSKEDFDFGTCRLTMSQYLVKEKGLVAVINNIANTFGDNAQQIYKRVPLHLEFDELNDEEFKKLWLRPYKRYPRQRSHGYWEIKRIELEWLKVIPRSNAPLYIEGWTEEAYNKIPNFEFITSNQISPSAKVILDQMRKQKKRQCLHCKCHCTGFCHGCSSELFGTQCKYNDQGRLCLADGRSLSEVDSKDFYAFECNRMQCAKVCGKECRQSVVTKGRKVPIVIFYEPRIDGWTVRTLVDLKEGTFIADYIGKVYQKCVANTLVDKSYQFEIGTQLVIDSKKAGNEARFFSHSCSPNLTSVRIFSEGFHYGYHKICFFAARDIAAGEELTFDYHPLGIKPDNHNSTCECGSAQCRGWV